MDEKALREDFIKQGYSCSDIDRMFGMKQEQFQEIEGLPFGCVPTDGKPYPSEHACRLQSPDKYDRFARKNCFRRVAGKCLDVIFGIKNNKSEVQAYRYKKSVWSVDAARSHCKDANGSFEAASE